MWKLIVLVISFWAPFSPPCFPPSIIIIIVRSGRMRKPALRLVRLLAHWDKLYSYLKLMKAANQAHGRAATKKKLGILESWARKTLFPIPNPTFTYTWTFFPNLIRGIFRVCSVQKKKNGKRFVCYEAHIPHAKLESFCSASSVENTSKLIYKIEWNLQTNLPTFQPDTARLCGVLWNPQPRESCSGVVVVGVKNKHRQVSKLLFSDFPSLVVEIKDWWEL